MSESKSENKKSPISPSLSSTASLRFLLLGILCLITQIGNKAGILSDVYINVILFWYVFFVGLLLLGCVVVIYTVFQGDDAIKLFTSAFSLDELNKTRLDAVRAIINKRIFIGEGKLIFWAYGCLSAAFFYYDLELALQATLSVMVSQRILSLCYKSLFIGILHDLDSAELIGFEVVEDLPN